MAVSSKFWVFYNPRTEPSTIQLKEERIYHWMSNGAQPSESVLQVFRSAGLLDRYERYKRVKHSIRSCRNLSLLKLSAMSARRHAWRARLRNPRRHKGCLSPNL